jgi:hypothetical protein
LSSFKLSQSCDQGWGNARAYRILFTGSYAVRGYLTSSCRALMLNIALWVSREDARRGAPVCPACNKCPRRINGKYCGISCEKYDKERLQRPRQQQQQHPTRPPAGVRPHLSAPSPSGNVAWGTAPGDSSPVGNFAPDNQNLLPAGGT